MVDERARHHAPQHDALARERRRLPDLALHLVRAPGIPRLRGALDRRDDRARGLVLGPRGDHARREQGDQDRASRSGAHRASALPLDQEHAVDRDVAPRHDGPVRKTDRRPTRPPSASRVRSADRASWTRRYERPRPRLALPRAVARLTVTTAPTHVRSRDAGRRAEPDLEPVVARLRPVPQQVGRGRRGC